MFEVLKNRLLNGYPYLKSTALARIDALANQLEITQQQADELSALVMMHGLDVLPEDYDARLTAVESATNDLTLMMADMIGGAM